VVRLGHRGSQLSVTPSLKVSLICAFAMAGHRSRANQARPSSARTARARQMKLRLLRSSCRHGRRDARTSWTPPW
jgi:hypothetical protein